MASKPTNRLKLRARNTLYALLRRLFTVEKSPRRCSRCKKPILKHHRWLHKRSRLLGFLRETMEHRDCLNPTLDPRIVHGLVETPLFDGVDSFDIGGPSESR